jgi:restriction system protein
MYSLAPRKFEELIAELYRRPGYEALLTPASGDRGVDVYVISHDDLGSTLWVVQAKRWAPNRKIGAGVARELVGAVYSTGATAGILVTTSFFQPGARQIQREFNFRLSLRDYEDLKKMLSWGVANHDPGPRHRP